MKEKTKADYYIEIKYGKTSESPSRVFQTMYELIEELQKLDKSLVTCIDSHIEPILLLEDIETGSIRSYLSTFLKSLDDDGIKELNVKKLIGSYLVKGKYRIINFLEKKKTITNIKEVKELQEDLLTIAKETNVNWLPYYTPLDATQLLYHIQAISVSLSHLDSKKDSAKYVGEKEAKFNLEFNIAPDSMKELIKSNLIVSNKSPKGRVPRACTWVNVVIAR